jgi:hypothetical protein
MAVQVRGQNVVVSSDHDEATGAVAQVIANVMDKNWLEGTPHSEPLAMTVDQSGTEVKYVIRPLQ